LSYHAEKTDRQTDRQTDQQSTGNAYRRSSRSLTHSCIDVRLTCLINVAYLLTYSVGVGIYRWSV